MGFHFKHPTMCVSFPGGHLEEAGGPEGRGRKSSVCCQIVRKSEGKRFRRLGHLPQVCGRRQQDVAQRLRGTLMGPSCEGFPGQVSGCSDAPGAASARAPVKRTGDPTLQLPTVKGPRSEGSVVRPAGCPHHTAPGPAFLASEFSPFLFGMRNLNSTQ